MSHTTSADDPVAASSLTGSPAEPSAGPPRAPERLARDDAAAIGPFRPHEPVLVVDRKNRKYLIFLAPELRFDLRGGLLLGSEIIGKEPGSRLYSTRREALRVYRPTLEEYCLLMPRGATIIPPKDVGTIIQWGDFGPGAVVVEAGIGSGAMTLGLLRAVGPRGRVISYDVRQDFINLARKNIGHWPERLDERHEARLGDIHQELHYLRGIDRLMLDLPCPWDAVPGACHAIRPGGLLLAYNPSIRQIDRLVQELLRSRQFREPEIVETIQRPWVADAMRLRPELRMVGHSGFVLRAWRRSDDEIVEAPAAAARGDDAAPLGDADPGADAEAGPDPRAD